MCKRFLKIQFQVNQKNHPPKMIRQIKPAKVTDLRALMAFVPSIHHAFYQAIFQRAESQATSSPQGHRDVEGVEAGLGADSC